MMMLNGLAAWTGFLCALVGLVALPLALFAAGSGHPGWAMVAAAVLLGSLGVGVGFVATVVHYDHRHHNRPPRACYSGQKHVPPRADSGPSTSQPHGEGRR